MSTKTGRLFIAIDGNSIGRVIGGYILAERFTGLKAFSEYVSGTVQALKRDMEARGGQVYLAGGDNLLACMPQDGLEEVCRLVADAQTEKLRFAIGVGPTSRHVYLALKYAKTFGHRRVDYDDDFTCQD